MEQVIKEEQRLRNNITSLVRKLRDENTDRSPQATARFLMLAEEVIAGEKDYLLKSLEKNLTESAGTYEAVRYGIFKQDYITGV